MSTSYSVVGIRPPDDRHDEMTAIWTACKRAHVELPDEVLAFFDDRSPDPKGLEIPLPTNEGQDEYRNWYTLSVSDIPKNITEIRFVMSE